jgi:GPN-loop GTPase
MEEFDLGPNGGLIYCMEYLLENFEWLEEKLQALSSRYILFDCPGQVELYTHHTSVHKIIENLQLGARSGKQEDLDCRLCSVHLIDSYYCRSTIAHSPPTLTSHSFPVSMPATFISAVLLVASTMMRLALPHVSVLSKVPRPAPCSLFSSSPQDLSRWTSSITTESCHST